MERILIMPILTISPVARCDEGCAEGHDAGEGHPEQTEERGDELDDLRRPGRG